MQVADKSGGILAERLPEVLRALPKGLLVGAGIGCAIGAAACIMTP